ncbi:sugar phosphate isomerase/epimerase [Cohnella mopanensis]|uniref:sugar phosphate isomerase/epimerase n=1 Tax=Cohnella mopanensis TaxID=2911966 RepID=UPI001EF8C4D1|nr:sugar phosphate isomerase/epimerase [Cohnella mopanensis]
MGEETRESGNAQRDPKLYLAVDNCFASKRWTKPAEWMTLLQSMGISHVEASADNECDPLYMSKEYLDNWVREVNSHTEKTGVRVANMYSGHGTYTTLGLAHHDISIRDRIQHEWIKPMANIAASVGAGLGFYCHAFADATLQVPSVYKEREEDLYSRLAEISVLCRELGIRAPSVEQMYTPHQIPWTIEGSKKLLKEVFGKSASPFYLTLDTGHQSGQHKFRRPEMEEIQLEAERNRQDGTSRPFWVGPYAAYDLFVEMCKSPIHEQTAYMNRINELMDGYPYLFAEAYDSDTYRWLEELGAYSPIVHLQQTTGTSSAHQPFTEACNKDGLIFGEPLLRALKRAYQKPEDVGMPPRCEDIYLTLEIFSGTSESNSDVLRKMEESITYWRKYIPRDGLKLSEAIDLLGER